MDDQEYTNSAWDVWLPLLIVAEHLGDDQFISFAMEQIEAKVDEDDLTQVFEPRGVVLGEIITLYREALKNRERRIPITGIRAAIQERGYGFDERQITKEVKGLGFDVYKPGNKMHIKIVHFDQLKQLAEKAGATIDIEEEKDKIKETSLELEPVAS